MNTGFAGCPQTRISTAFQNPHGYWASAAGRMDTGFAGTPQTRMDTGVAQSRMGSAFEGCPATRMDTGFELQDPAKPHQHCISEVRKPAWLLGLGTRRNMETHAGQLRRAEKCGGKQKIGVLWDQTIKGRNHKFDIKHSKELFVTQTQRRHEVFSSGIRRGVAD